MMLSNGAANRRQQRTKSRPVQSVYEEEFEQLEQPSSRKNFPSSVLLSATGRTSQIQNRRVPYRFLTTILNNGIRVGANDEAKATTIDALSKNFINDGRVNITLCIQRIALENPGAGVQTYAAIGRLLKSPRLSFEQKYLIQGTQRTLAAKIFPRLNSPYTRQ